MLIISTVFNVHSSDLAQIEARREDVLRRETIICSDFYAVFTGAETCLGDWGRRRNTKNGKWAFFGEKWPFFGENCFKEGDNYLFLFFMYLTGAETCLGDWG